MHHSVLDIPLDSQDLHLKSMIMFTVLACTGSYERVWYIAHHNLTSFCVLSKDLDSLVHRLSVHSKQWAVYIVEKLYFDLSMNAISGIS